MRAGDVPALRADRLGKRYGRMWGLRDCTFSVPAGSVVGLVGPNGAGKTTLLALTVGLLAPTEGRVEVFGAASRAHTAATLARVSYLAQDHPLYRGFSVADMFRLGRSMNPAWDEALARARIDALGIPPERKIKVLSGGQQAQVALTMALAKRAPLLVLDEPVASLDPIARLEFMRDVMTACAEGGLARRAPGADRAAGDPGHRAARHDHRPDRQRPALDRAGRGRPGRARRNPAAPMAGRAGQLRATGAGLPPAPAGGGGYGRLRPGPGRPAGR